MKPDIQVRSGELLKEYYANYLREIRGTKESTIKHYYDALNNISRRLKTLRMIENDIYEIRDIEYLETVRNTLYADKDFVETDTRGNRMYSAGLNNYIRFARGEGFANVGESANTFDIPSVPEEPTVSTTVVWKRSGILRNQVIAMANYSCEIDSKHISFIAEKTNKPYMEGHHAIPMKFQDEFSNSLDVYANIICLCPLCHRKIHYGMRAEKEKMSHQLYEMREARLDKSGLSLSRNEFTEIVVGEH